MASSKMDRRTVVSAQVSMTSLADVYTLTPGKPINIVRWGIIADALIDVGAGLTVKADHRIDAGTDTGRTDGTVGDITVTADILQGDGVYTEDVSGAADKTPFEVDPGEEVVFEVTDIADTAGTGMIFVEYEELPFVGDANATAGSFSNRIGNMTSND